jgi:hypothetical protein
VGTALGVVVPLDRGGGATQVAPQAQFHLLSSPFDFTFANVLLTVVNHQLYKSTRIKRRVKMSFTLDLGVLN